MREIFYVLRDEKKKPVVTVCLLIDESTHWVVARGVAICSDKETPCMKLDAQQRNGPALARKKAYKTLKARKNQFPILRIEPMKVVSRVLLAGGEEKQFDDIGV